MDISISKQVITQAIKVRTDEITALQASLDLLNGTYKAEFTALETAQKESNDKAIEVNAERQKVIAHEVTISDLTTQVETISVEKETLATQLEAMNVKIAPVELPAEIIKE